MRKALLVLVFCGFAASLWAADPSVGTWKYNVSKAKLAPSDQAAVKEQTVIIKEAGDQWEIAQTGTRIDGSSISQKYTRSKQGGIVKGQPPLPEGQSYIDTVIEPGNWYLTVLQNGKQVSVTHCVVSRDGKTLQLSTQSTDAKGKSYQEVEVYDRQ